MEFDTKDQVFCFVHILLIHHLCSFKIKKKPTAFLLLYCSASKKLEAWSVYKGIEDNILFVLTKKQSLREILLLGYFVNNFINFWFFFWKSNVSENIQKFSTYIISTKYLSRDVLHSKQMGGYLLSPHLSTAAFYKNAVLWSLWKNV